MTSKKNEAGRPPKITDKIVNEMKQYMVAGLSLKDACTLLEIGYNTWNDYERNHPDIRAKRKAWQNMLKAQAQANIAKQVLSVKDPSWSSYILDRELKLEEKRANSSLIRARAKRERIQATLLQKQVEQTDQVAGKALDKMQDLTTEQLISLTHLADEDDEEDET
ncbi:hypothetical protein [Lactobacillus sp.]|uniref:hypothetical protein n=1 Tax=Lactobacillus sp. TaxID=1591 RepID=UPI0019CDD538|nr:hypothetical protein [Lactobacillus sp.]MBD5430130.1 hypothetical protein [Lactobacillus sp.]